MMNIQQFPYGPIEANSYLIETDTSLVLIDPSVPLSLLPEFRKPMKAIIVTHCHYDHISCIEQIKQATNAPVYCHSLEFPAFRDAEKNASAYFLENRKYPLPDIAAQDNDILHIDDQISLQFLHTPGHTMGSTSILLKENNMAVALFTGDTLFKGSAGRTDLGGNPRLLQQSLHRLKQYADSVLIYSGHGEVSTIGEEKRSNPFLQNIDS